MRVLREGFMALADDLPKFSEEIKTLVWVIQELNSFLTRWVTHLIEDSGLRR